MIFRPKIIDTLKQYDREQFVKDLWAGVIVGIVALPLPAPVWPSLDLDTIIARTATNIKNGGRSPVAGMVHASTLLLIVLFVGKWASRLPIIDATGLRVLREVCKESTHRGTKLILTEVHSSQVMRELKESRLLFTIGKANITGNLMEAIQRGSHVMAENSMIDPETAAQLSGGGPPISPRKSF